MNIKEKLLEIKEKILNKTQNNLGLYSDVET